MAGKVAVSNGVKWENGGDIRNRNERAGGDANDQQYENEIQERQKAGQEGEIYPIFEDGEVGETDAERPQRVIAHALGLRKQSHVSKKTRSQEEERDKGDMRLRRRRPNLNHLYIGRRRR